MSVRVRFGVGGEGEALALDGEKLVLVSPRAFAHGERVALEIDLPDTPLAVRGKCLGAKKREDALFDTTLRLESLRREDRDRLSRALG